MSVRMAPRPSKPSSPPQSRIGATFTQSYPSTESMYADNHGSPILTNQIGNFGVSKGYFSQNLSTLMAHWDLFPNMSQDLRIGLAVGNASLGGRSGYGSFRRAAHRYAYSGCGSTAYSYLPR